LGGGGKDAEGRGLQDSGCPQVILQTVTTTTDTTETEIQRRLGQSYKKTSIILGVIGMFILGIPLGIAAFIFARKAETQGVKATAGIVLAVLDIVLAIVVMVVLKPFNI